MAYLRRATLSPPAAVPQPLPLPPPPPGSNRRADWRWRAGIAGVWIAACAPLLHPRPDPTSKFYVVDLEGSGELISPDRIEALTDKSLHDAQGATITTTPGSTNALVLSNGTALFLSGDTRLDVQRFRQSAFLPERSELEREPSLSVTEILIPRGSVSISTPTLSPGSSLVFATPHGLVSVHGGTVVIEVGDDETRVTVTSGEATVTGNAVHTGNRRISAGRQVIARAAPGEIPTLVTGPIPARSAPFLGYMAQSSENARRAVYFEIAPLPPPTPTVASASDDEGGGDDKTESDATDDDASADTDTDDPPQAGDELTADFADFAAGADLGAFAPGDGNTGTENLTGVGYLGVFNRDTTGGNTDDALPADQLFVVEVTPLIPLETPVSVSSINN